VTKEPNRLRNKLLVIYIPIIILVLIVLSVFNYNNTKKNLLDKHYESKNLSEQHIVDTLSLIDTGYRMLEVKLEDELKDKGLEFLEVYEQVEGNLDLLDDMTLRNALGDSYDFIVIDKNTSIIKSTEPMALGFNFKEFDLELGAKIDDIRHGNEIWFEQIRTNVGTGKLSKFAYIPTTEKNVLLEVGYSIDGFDDLIDEMKPHHYLRSLVDVNPSVVSIRLFDTYGYQMVDSGEGYVPTVESKKIVSKLTDNDRYEEIIDDEITKQYIKINLNEKRERTLANTDRIVEIIYSSKLINEKLSSLLIASTAINAIVLGGLILSIIYFTGRITKPLESLKSMTNEIAKGNYSSVVNIDTNDEIGQLAASYNRMIQDINKSFKENESQNKKLEEYSQNLELIVQERTQKIAKQKQMLERIAMLDSLTEIPNRRSFDERFTYEWGRAMREGVPLSLMIADVDAFKEFNDYYGHGMGDDVLKAVAEVLSETIERSTDFVARIGGEEFAVILPAINENDAIDLGNKMLDAIRALKIPHAYSNVSELLTLSIGGATFIPQPNTVQRVMFECADRMLYQAKKTGKDKLIWSEDES